MTAPVDRAAIAANITAITDTAIELRLTPMGSSLDAMACHSLASTLSSAAAALLAEVERLEGENKALRQERVGLRVMERLHEAECEGAAAVVAEVTAERDALAEAVREVRSQLLATPMGTSLDAVACHHLAGLLPAAPGTEGGRDDEQG